jgi:hypothetical protein
MSNEQPSHVVSLPRGDTPILTLTYGPYEIHQISGTYRSSQIVGYSRFSKVALSARSFFRGAASYAKLLSITAATQGISLVIFP